MNVPCRACDQRSYGAGHGKSQCLGTPKPRDEGGGAARKHCQKPELIAVSFDIKRFAWEGFVPWN